MVNVRPSWNTRLRKCYRRHWIVVQHVPFLLWLVAAVAGLAGGMIWSWWFMLMLPVAVLPTCVWLFVVSWSAGADDEAERQAQARANQ